MTVLNKPMFPLLFHPNTKTAPCPLQFGTWWALGGKASAVACLEPEGERQRSRKEEEEWLAKHGIERRKVTYLQVVQNELVKSWPGLWRRHSYWTSTGQVEENSTYVTGCKKVSVVPELLNAFLLSHLILRSMDFFMISRGRWAFSKGWVGVCCLWTGWSATQEAKIPNS